MNIFIYWSPTWTVILIIGELIFAALCGYVATEKKRSGGAWFVAGFFLGIIALIALAAIPALTEEELKKREAEEDDDPELNEWREKMKGPTR